MKNLLDKLNYKGQKRISVINAEEHFIDSISTELRDVIIDRKIDPRYPYQFIIIFLKADGVVWFCYPKKTSKKYSSDIDRDHGWKMLNDSGLYAIRMVAIDKDWSSVRFRNKKYIKSTSDRFTK